MTAFTPPSAGLDDTPSGPPSLVPVALLAGLAILPMLMLALLLPTIHALTRGGQQSPWVYAATLALMALLPIGIVLMLRRRRGAFTVFSIAAACSLATVGSPFGRIIVCAGLVALIGAVMAWLRRDPGSRTRGGAAASSSSSPS